MPPILAESGVSMSDFLVPGIGIIVLAGVAFTAIIQVKKWNARDNSSTDAAPAGFSLSDLRRLHKAGKISDEEFEKARNGVITAAQRVAARDEAARVAKQQSAVRKLAGLSELPIEHKKIPEEE